MDKFRKIRVYADYSCCIVLAVELPQSGFKNNANSNDDFINRILFIICGTLFAIFLVGKSYSFFSGMKDKGITFKYILRKIGIITFVSILWMIPFWMVWAWIISIF